MTNVFRILKLGVLTLGLMGCGVPAPRSWSAADYGDDYRAKGLVPPKQIWGSPPSFAEGEKNCVARDMAALVDVHCMVGVDGGVSKCQVRSPIAGCEQAMIDVVHLIEETYRYRPKLWDGRPIATSFTYNFHVHGEAVREAPHRPVPAGEVFAVRDHRLPFDHELRTPIAGTAPSFQEHGDICIPPGTAAVMTFDCIIGVDGTLSACHPFPYNRLAGCDEAVANAAKTMEETWRFRRVIRDGKPAAVSHWFTFHILGAGVRAAPRALVKPGTDGAQP